MTHLKLALAAVIVTACGATKDPAAELDGGIDTLGPDGPDASGPQPTPACAADPAQCLYVPPALPVELVEVMATDPDRVGGPRTLNVAIRYSPAAALPMPIVVWSHGGAGGQTNAAGALDAWAIAAAEAGYFSVAIAHSPRDEDSRRALCMSLGLDATACATFKFLSYDRPHDIALVIDRLVELSAEPEFLGKLDTGKLAVGGHSAGAGGTLMVAGASRDIGGTPTLIADPRPIAFLAFSPQAPGSDGMTEAGYGLVTRPVLIGTGRGDHNPPDTADGRAQVFDLIQPGNKARIFIEDAAAIHGLFSLSTDNCTSTASLAHCEEMRDWLKASGLAFLDAHVRGLPDAVAWLASSNLAVASGGVAEWSTR